MISAATVNVVIALLFLVFAYIVSITCIGSLQALVAAQLGDESAIEAGYLSFNPMVYYDTLGFISLIIFGFGWGRTFPFQPNMLQEPYKKCKIALIYLMQPIIALCLALVAIVLSVKLMGQEALPIIYYYTSMHAIFKSLNIQALTELYSASSALLLILVILMSLATVNIFLAAWGLVSGLLDHTRYAQSQHAGWAGTNYQMLIASICLFVFLFPVVHFSMLKFTMGIARYALEGIKLL